VKHKNEAPKTKKNLKNGRATNTIEVVVGVHWKDLMFNLANTSFNGKDHLLLYRIRIQSKKYFI